MTLQHISDLKTPIGDVLPAPGTQGVLLEAEGKAQYAIMPLDDDLLDYLLERNPKLIEECRQIRERMRAGKSHSHDAVRKMFTEDI
jgi:hypothetical protein